MTKKFPDISIIIVSSGLKYLTACLESLTPALIDIKNELIVVDNASKDNIKKYLKINFPDIQVLRREVNGGFGENNNLGLKIATGRYVLLLNDDTKVINKKIFSEMLSWMDSHPNVGVAGCALVNSDQQTFQGSGGYFPSILRVFAWMTFLDDIPYLDRLIKPYHPMHTWSPFYKGEAFFNKPHKQDWVTGAFYLMRKSALDEVGYFDEDFFLYVEEVDLSLRFAKKGWERWYLPQWKIVHYGQVTTGSSNAIIHEFKNLKTLYRKHYPRWQRPVLTIILKLGAALRVLVLGILKGKDVSKTYIRVFKEL